MYARRTVAEYHGGPKELGSRLCLYISARMQLQHVDLSTLDRLFKGDRSRVDQWIRLYLSEAPAYVGELAKSHAANDAVGMASAAHDLRPQAHYLGNSRMLELLIDIDERLRMDGVSACGEQVSELLELCTAVDDELKGVLDRSQ